MLKPDGSAEDYYHNHWDAKAGEDLSRKGGSGLHFLMGGRGYLSNIPCSTGSFLQFMDRIMVEQSNSESPRVGIIMGSTSDWPTLSRAAEVLREFRIPYEAKVVSAHRTPELLFSYAKSARERGLKCIIAGAGGAAHLPGMASALTIVPVLAVPVQSRVLNGVDSLLSIVQMPAGIPTATFAIGDAGATNAGLFAVSLLAMEDEQLATQLTDYRESLRAKVEAMELPLLPPAE